MKIYKYLIIMIVLVLVFEIMGLPTGAETVLNLIGVSLATGAITITASTFFDAIFSSSGILIAGLTSSAVVLGLLAGLRENALIIPFITGTLIAFAGIFTGIMQQSVGTGNEAWLGAIVVVILAPFSIGFLVSLVEFFRGTD